MPAEIYQVDAFTAEPFAGNPAAVCLLRGPADSQWMQSVAAEMNLSETAFLESHSDGYGLRWFTPAVEVDLCGHATLASAHVLWEVGHTKPGQAVRFHTRSGVLRAVRDGAWITMDFPATPPLAAEVDPRLCAALGVTPRVAARSRVNDWLVEVQSEAELRALEPDLKALGAVDARGVMVTARAVDPRFDFVSRFFAPAVGVPEDPVTGSAHCALGPFWAERLRRNDLIGLQASRRGGVVRVSCVGDRVHLGGQAVTVLHGQLTV